MGLMRQISVVIIATGLLAWGAETTTPADPPKDDHGQLTCVATWLIVITHAQRGGVPCKSPIAWAHDRVTTWAFLLRNAGQTVSRSRINEFFAIPRGN
jgi:hypothetical protein